MSTVTFTTHHSNTQAQLHMATYLKTQGFTITFLDHPHKTTAYTAPTTLFDKHLAAIKCYITTLNGTPLKQPKTAVEDHMHMEFKWCKVNHNNCAECGLRDTYCSRRELNQKT